MGEFNKEEKIVRLILKELSETISETEKKELENWINIREENKALYKKLKNSSNYEEWEKTYAQFDKKEGWNFLSKKIIQQKKKEIAFRICKYAAIIFLPITISVCLLPLTHKHNNIQETTIIVNGIRPGTAKAILTLGNGKSVLLDEKAKLLIKETDGTFIQKRHGTLYYSEILHTQKNSTKYNTITTPRGGEFRLTLSDGTRICLNSLSQLKYPTHFDGNNREVELTGEAYFDVIHNPHKPFIVKTGNKTVQVLGTSFNINADKLTGTIATTLVRGKVMISSNRQTGIHILKPNEQAIYSDYNDHIIIKKVDTSLYTAWKDGQFIFHDCRLDEIMNTLSRWYCANIFYKDTKVKRIRFSGNLNKYSDIYQFLDIIQTTNNVEIKTIKNNIFLSSKK